MNDLQVFIYSGEQLRTIQREDGLWWVLRDVCEVLGLTTPARVAERLDSDEKAEMSLTHTSSNGVEQARITTIINEPGLYSVIIRSDKPEAKNFKRWVTHDVLPSIRKTGQYGVPQARIRDLADAQGRLDEWRNMLGLCEGYTATACKEYERARKSYDSARKVRDDCRKYIKIAQADVDSIVSLITAPKL